MSQPISEAMLCSRQQVASTDISDRGLNESAPTPSTFLEYRYAVTQSLQAPARTPALVAGGFDKRDARETDLALADWVGRPAWERRAKPFGASPLRGEWEPHAESFDSYTLTDEDWSEITALPAAEVLQL